MKFRIIFTEESFKGKKNYYTKNGYWSNNNKIERRERK